MITAHRSTLTLMLFLLLPLMAHGDDGLTEAERDGRAVAVFAVDDSAPYSEPPRAPVANDREDRAEQRRERDERLTAGQPSGQEQLLADAEQVQADQETREAEQAAADAAARRQREQALQQKASADAATAAAAHVVATQIDPEDTRNPAGRMLLILLAILTTCGLTWYFGTRWYSRD